MIDVKFVYRLCGRIAGIRIIWRKLLFLVIFLVVGLLGSTISFASAVLLISFSLWLPAPSFSQSSPSVEISEIMYDPVQDDNYNEWVEIKNLSSVPIDLSNWTLCGKKLLAGYIDRGGGVRSDGGLMLEGGGYGLITDGGSGTEVYTNFDVDGESLALHIDASSLCGGSLPNTAGKEKELVLSDGTTTVSVRYRIEWGGNGNGKSVAVGSDGAWKEAEPTPGRANEFSEEDVYADSQVQGHGGKSQKPQPTVDFSVLPHVFAGTPFSVTVKLSNFSQGTYSIKVLIGGEGKFYDGQTKGIDGRWLAQNIAWKYFPTVAVDSSGVGVATVQAKVDDDAAAGDYGIKVRVHDGKNNYDSEVIPLGVAVAPLVADDSESAEEAQDLEGGELTAEVADGGEVLGEEVPQGKGFKLNFYIILGIFGLLVGSGGLILVLRKGVWQPQTGDIPEPEPNLP